MAQKQLSAIPQSRDCISHSLRRDEDGLRVTWTVTFDYPDCIRTFDGAKWTVEAKETAQ